MTTQRFDIVPTTYQHIQRFLDQICGFGQQAFEPPHKLTELRLYFADEAVRYAERLLHRSVSSKDEAKMLQAQHDRFVDAYTSHMAGAATRAVGGLALPDLLAGTYPPDCVNKLNPTVQDAVLTMSQAVNKAIALYETLTFLISQVHTRKYAGGNSDPLTRKEDVVIQALNARWQMLSLRLLRLQVLAATPESLAALKADIKAQHFAPGISVIENLQSNGVVPNGWPASSEQAFRGNILAS